MIYLICFAVSAIWAELACNAESRKKFLLYSAASIAITALLAGLRDYTVGIDTSNYLNFDRFWRGAVEQDTLGGYLNHYKQIVQGEYLFALMLGITESLFGSFTVFLLLVHTVIITGVYIGAYRMRQYTRPWLVLLLFYLIFFNQSLNILRQYMAMAMVFTVLVDVPRKKYWRFILMVILASQIHRTALLSLGILVVDWYLSCDLPRVGYYVRKVYAWLKEHLIKRKKPVEEKRDRTERVLHFRGKELRLPDPFALTVPQRQMAMFMGLLFLVIIFNPLCRLLIAIGLLPQKYAFYLDFSRVEINILSTLFLVVEMAAIMFLYKYMRKASPVFDFFFANSLVYLALQQLSFFLVYGRRIAAYNALPNLITISLISGVYKDKNKRIAATVITVFVALVYWLYAYVLRNASHTFPYRLIF